MEKSSGAIKIWAPFVARPVKNYETAELKGIIEELAMTLPLSESLRAVMKDKNSP